MKQHDVQNAPTTAPEVPAPSAPLVDPPGGNAAAMAEVGPADTAEATPTLDGVEAAPVEVEAEAEDVLEDVEQPFTADDGAHHLWFEMVGDEAVPMVASTPSRLEDFVNRISPTDKATLETQQDYAGQLDTIRNGAESLRGMAETVVAGLRAGNRALPALLLPLTAQQQEVIQALRYVFRVLPNGRGAFGIDMYRARLDDVVVRLERCLDAAGHSQQNKGMVDWIYEIEGNLGWIRESLLAPRNQDDLDVAAEGIGEAEVTLTGLEEALGPAITERETVDTALEGEESDVWREKQTQILAILAKARATVTASVPFGRVRFRGSLSTGWKGPHKTENGKARRFNPEEFDADAFLELPNEEWKKIVATGDVDEGELYAKVPDLVSWPHRQMMLNLEGEIGEQLEEVAGYQHEEGGELHFDFTVQPMSSSWKNMRDGLAYPEDAFPKSIQDTLPDRPDTAKKERTRFPGIFQGE
jgi:hypothetical protein